MPLPNEHAARQLDPSQFERFMRKAAGADGISFIVGFRGDGSSDVQSVRADADKWTTDLVSVRFIVRGGGNLVDTNALRKLIQG